VPEQQLPGAGQQAAEQLTDGVCGATGKVAHGGMSHIGRRPAADHRVEREDHKGRDHPDDGRDPPARRAEVALCHQPHAGDGVMSTIPADKHFRHHDGDTDHCDTQQINQHEGATTVFAGNVGELPDITETDGRTGCRQNKRQPGRPETTSGP